MSVLITLILTAFLTLSTPPTLAVTPLSGLAPVSPTITLTVPGPFTGNACLTIADTDLQLVSGPFCVAVEVPAEQASVTTFSLTSRAPGVYVFVGFVLPKEGAPIETNHVRVTVTPHGDSA